MLRPLSYTLLAVAIILGALFVVVPRLNQEAALTGAESTPVIEAPPPARDPHDWNQAELDILSSLWLEALPPLPPDPSNAVADNPAAATLGHELFFDTRFSSNVAVSCATCHKTELMFTDGKPRATGVGVTPRKTMTIIGMAYSPWMFWDGRKDSQWSQALGPMESAVEHGGNRGMYAHILAADESYRQQYEALFGEFPDISDTARFPLSAGPVEDAAASAAWEQMTAADRDTINRIFVNMGKAIAAYERLIMPGPSRFDEYVAAARDSDRARMQDIYSEREARGLHLYIGEAQCINCHNGPLLTNNSFHNTGIPPASDLPPDFGRIEGIMQVLEDPFNCMGEYSDAGEDDCDHVKYARTEGQEIIAAFKTPTLRNVANTAPYMHSGQIPDLPSALDHYNRAPLAVRGHSELSPLNLSAAQLADLEAFLRSLSSPLATPEALLQSPHAGAQDTVTGQ